MLAVLINYVEVIENIFEYLKIPTSAPLPRVNVTENKLLLKDVSPAALALLEELTALDRQLFAYARREYSIQ